MKGLTVLLLLVSLVAVSKAQTKCAIQCTSEWNPVCALSSKTGVLSTFPGVCMMTMNNQCYKGDYIMMYSGMCKS